MLGDACADYGTIAQVGPKLGELAVIERWHVAAGLGDLRHPGMSRRVGADVTRDRGQRALVEPLPLPRHRGPVVMPFTFTHRPNLVADLRTLPPEPIALRLQSTAAVLEFSRMSSCHRDGEGVDAAIEFAPGVAAAAGEQNT